MKYLIRNGLLVSVLLCTSAIAIPFPWNKAMPDGGGAADDNSGMAIAADMESTISFQSANGSVDLVYTEDYEASRQLLKVHLGSTAASHRPHAIWTVVP